MRDQILAESPLRQGFWALFFLFTGWFSLAQGSGGVRIALGVGFLALGFFILRHLVTKGTVLLVETERTTGPIGLERRMNEQEKTAFCERLRGLGFPI